MKNLTRLMSRMTRLFKNWEKSNYKKVAYNFSNNCCYCVENIWNVFVACSFCCNLCEWLYYWCVLDICDAGMVKKWNDKMVWKKWWGKWLDEMGYSIWNPHPPLWKKDTGIPIPAGLDVKSSQEIFVSLTHIPAEHCGRFWYQVWFQLDPLTFERKIPAEDCIELSISSWNFSLRFQFQKTPCGRF